MACCSATVTLLWRARRKVHHVRKQLQALSAQLMGTEKEVAMLMERGIKVGPGSPGRGRRAGVAM